jgi:hypothetical protein
MIPRTTTVSLKRVRSGAAKTFHCHCQCDAAEICAILQGCSEARNLLEKLNILMYHHFSFVVRSQTQ